MDSPKISNKIKEAIKAKLIELEAYVDDELPEYIMVMVANKKTATQMENDLEIFLHSHAKTFTKWLFLVLDKLKNVTKVKKTVAKSEKKEKKNKVEQKSSKKAKSVDKTPDDVTKKVDKKQKESKETQGARTESTAVTLPEIHDTSEETIPGKSVRKPISAPEPTSKEERKDTARQRTRLESSKSSDSEDKNRTRTHRDRPLNKDRRRRSSTPRRSSSPYQRFRHKRSPPRRGRPRFDLQRDYRTRGLRSDDYPRRDRTRSPVRSRSKRISRERRSRSRSDTRHREESTERKDTKRPTLMSSVGAVVRHDDSDDGYDPMSLLQKSVASTVQVPRPKKVTSVTCKKSKRPLEVVSKSLVLKAVQEADDSIKKKKKEEFEREMILNQIRQQSKESRRRQAGPVDMSGDLDDLNDEEKRLIATNNLKNKFVIEISNRRSTKSSGDDDLRVHLLKRKKVEQPREEEMPSKKSFREDEKKTPIPENISKVEVEEDRDLQEMRRRALESLARGHSKSSTSIKTHASSNKKVIVPLDENSSDDSDSGSSTSSDDEDGTSSSDQKEKISKEKVKKSETTFVVTLDGIDSSYFRNKNRTAEAESRPILLKNRQTDESQESKQRGINEPIILEQRKSISVPVLAAVGGGSGLSDPKNNEAIYRSTKKPEAKVAPIQSSAIKTEKDDVKKVRKRITAPERDPPQPKPSKPQCRYWPNCIRGAQCLFFHPPKPLPALVSSDKFRWTPVNAPL